MKTDTGGPAYPNFSYEEDNRGKYHPGMDLLDHHAGLAMLGLIISGDYEKGTGESDKEALVRTSSGIAEAMIAEKRRRENDWDNISKGADVDCQGC